MKVLRASLGAAVLAASFFPLVLLADDEKKDEKPAETRPEKEVTAEDLVPFERLEVELRKELWKVTQRYTIRRRVEEKTVRCRAETYAWLLARLPLASVAARELELGKYVIEKKGEGFSIDDTEGAFASCERVHEDAGRLVIVARGTVEGPLVPKTKGTGVIVARWKEDPDDKKQVRTDCFVFFRVASDELHRAIAPLREPLGKVLGAKLDGLVGCAEKVAVAIDKDPDKVKRALEKSKKVGDDEIEEFRKKFLLG